ncbi:MAG: type III pantothenate kinase [Prevotellaceae bacterium]|nr:type III pantothenate kinase [Prevotellaceae bacterium]
MSCNLLVDIGNSSAKIAFATGDEITWHGRISGSDVAEQVCQAAIKYRADKAMICSVATEPSALINALKEQGIISLLLNNSTPLPFKIAYRTPQTLGCDRIAAVAGALTKKKKDHLLVIDAGSCITYEFISGDTYLGGNIAPGLKMRLRSMHEHTARLPQTEAQGELPEIGHDTDTAIRCGALRGIQHEIEGYARMMHNQYGKPLQIVLTGGDAQQIKETLTVEADIDEALVLRGLNNILIYNEEND